ncbi:MAG: DNA translocase FtsK 4TM domain-containing protein [Patescibacteria group bacterium]
MARKKDGGISKHLDDINPIKDVKAETLQGVFAVISVVIGIFFTLAAFHKGGLVGEKSYSVLKSLLGIGYFLLPLFAFLMAVSFIKDLKQHFTYSKIVTSLLAFFSSLGIVDILAASFGSSDKGGIIGYYISHPLLTVFDFWASLVILLGILAISLILVFETRLDLHFIAFWKKLFSTKKKSVAEKERLLQERKNAQNEPMDDDEVEDLISTPETEERILPKKKGGAAGGAAGALSAANAAAAAKPEAKLKISEGEKEDAFMGQTNAVAYQQDNYIPLPLDLLEVDKGKPGVGDIKANANIIKRSLQNFGINVEMDEISIGPSVTRYALKPAEGVKLSRIVALQNDLSLALAAHPIRIEAPIPGKSLVGIEIPNSTKTTVGLGTLLATAEYQESDKPLLVALGKGVSGKSYYANIAKMPHLLIAGATGSGKSVTIHTLITSLLYRNSPQNLKFIMIDPKRVELTLYNKIPHLLTPVITDAKKAILSLKWAAKEMDRRYDVLEGASVRDIQSYHKNIVDPAKKRFETEPPKEGEKVPETMPYIVVVIDELADIMQTYPRELESAIVRLAQMSRAVGIHLVLSTQRPSVNVITGLIKANVPSRLALQVASQIDSRTILDMAGAEKLLGAGDMLYLGGEMAQPQRIQSAYISETELKQVVKFLAENYEGTMPSDITANAEKDKNVLFESSFLGGSSGDDASLEDDDELYEDARTAVIEAGKASTSYIQRKLRIGYSRAARLMDILEERGVIGPADGSKPRSVIGAEDGNNDVGGDIAGVTHDDTGGTELASDTQNSPEEPIV